VVGEVGDSSNTAIKVLNDLLEYDKIELDTIKIQTECVPFYKLVLKTLRPLLVQAREANITVKVVIDGRLYDWSEGYDFPSDVVFYGDEVKLGQVLRNIFSNALKFSPKDSLVDVTGMCVFLCCVLYLNLFCYSCMR
jgi:signal transduction histidine kinase